MDPRIHRIQQPLPKPPLKQKEKKAENNNEVSFKERLSQTIDKTESSIVKVSKHATQRLNERKIDINEKLWSEISSKVHEAKQKGVRDALVLTENSALIVSAKNNVVITAMDRKEASAQIFTNINGTILIDK